MSKSIFHRLSDISRIHHRAAFADVEHRIPGRKGHFLQLAEKRFSCRKFSGQAITETQVEHILEAARVAPTACNKQPVHVWAVKAPERLEALKDATKYTFDAPVVFVVGCKPEDAWVRAVDGKNGAEVDAAIVGTHIMMQAADMGLGSTWVGSFDPAALLKALPETEGWTPVALFPVGHPAGVPSANHTVRKTLEEFSTVI